MSQQKISLTNVSLLTGVPFDNGYAHTRWLNSVADQQAYFNKFVKKTVREMNYIKIVGKQFIDLEVNFEQAKNYNYMMYQNSEYGSKWFYAFIVNVQVLSPRTTRLFFEIDVIQTWRFDFTVKQSFVAREHESTNRNWNVIPEGQMLGNEYEIVKQYNVRPYPFYFFVICVKERFDLHYEPELYDGSFFGSPNTLSYYVLPVPYNVDGEGAIPDYKFTDSQGNYHSSTQQDIRRLFHEFRTNDKAPKNIVSMYVTDYLPLEITETDSFKFKIANAVQTTLNPKAENVTYVYCLASRSKYNHILEKKIGNVFDDINESADKLRYYPYTVIELSDGRGNVVNFKPEGLKKTNGDIILSFMGSVHFYNNVAYALNGYNNGSSKGDLISNSLINSDPQDIAVLDDKTTAYLQGNKNSIEARRKTWGDDLKYQQISNGVRGATSVANIGANAVAKNPNPSAYIDDVGSTIQSAVNFTYAGVDYENKINEQNAMMEDISNMPPSLIKQGSNANFSFGNNLSGVRVSIKRIRSQYLDNTRDFLHMFGVKTNSLKQPNLNSRTQWNYIQTIMCNVQCNFYNEDIQKIKAIFDSGITLWHNDDIYNYNKVNGVR